VSSVVHLVSSALDPHKRLYETLRKSTLLRSRFADRNRVYSRSSFPHVFTWSPHSPLSPPPTPSLYPNLVLPLFAHPFQTHTKLEILEFRGTVSGLPMPVYTLCLTCESCTKESNDLVSGFECMNRERKSMYSSIVGSYRTVSNRMAYHLPSRLSDVESVILLQLIFQTFSLEGLLPVWNERAVVSV